jgi:hypothetical protein
MCEEVVKEKYPYVQGPESAFHTSVGGRVAPTSVR